MAALCPGMPGRDDYDELIMCNYRAGETVIFDRPLDKSQIRDSGFDRSRDLRRIADREPDLDLWMGASKRHQMAGQPIAGNRLTCVHRKRAAF